MADKKTVLVIDDEPDTVDFIRTLLEDNGYSTSTAADAKQALDLIDTQRPDLITLDITMPTMSGVKFYREMKENDARKDIPIIIVTGVSEDFEKFISSRKNVPPPEGYVAKPIDQARLLELASQLTS